jgi:hypothetical protein
MEILGDSKLRRHSNENIDRFNAKKDDKTELVDEDIQMKKINKNCSKLNKTFKNRRKNGIFVS